MAWWVFLGLSLVRQWIHGLRQSLGVFESSSLFSMHLAIGRSFEPLVSGTSSSLLVLAQCLIRLWIHVLIQGGFWKYFHDFPRDWVDSAPEVILVVHCIWPMRKWPCSSSLTQWHAFTGFACDALRAVSRRLPAGPFFF